MSPEQEKFEDILAAHAAGALSDEQQRWLQAYLADHPEAGQELLMVEEIRSVLQKETRQIDPQEGLAAFMSAVKENPRQQVRIGLFDRLNTWLESAGFTPALASAIVTIQVGVIAALVSINMQMGQQQEIAGQYRSAPMQSLQKPDLKLTISPGTNFADLADLLREQGCRIVAGPSEYGEIWVVVDERNRLEEKRNNLSKSALIDDVMVVDGSVK